MTGRNEVHKKHIDLTSHVAEKETSTAGIVPVQRDHADNE